jgi:hypothetical protein
MRLGEALYHPSPFVRHVWVKDRITIMDIRSGSYFVLDPVGSFFWDELLQPLSNENRLRKLRDRFETDPARLEEDLDAFAAKCLEDGLLREGLPRPGSRPLESPRARRPARHFLEIRAWWRLIRISRSLRTQSFAAVYPEQMAPVPASDRDPEAEECFLQKALRAFARAENFCHLKKAPQDCLPRSLALFQFLRSTGLPALHCIGVRQFPFGAHAWVELRGRVLRDTPAVADVYTVIARLPHEPIPGEI